MRKLIAISLYLFCSFSAKAEDIIYLNSESTSLSTSLTTSPIPYSSIEITVKKSKYIILGPQTKRIKQLLPSLSTEEQDSFFKTRIDFLNQAAKALQALRWGFGMGIIIKNHFQYTHERKIHEQLIQQANQFDPSQRADMLMALQRDLPDYEQRWFEQKNKSFNQKADEVINQTLNSLDLQLWQQATIVAHANEFGVMAAIGIEAEGGTHNSKGWGGLTDIGLSIGYNRDEKALAIQIFHDLESFKSTQLPMVFIAGLVVKAGPYVANQGKDLTASGTSFYPPMAPGFSSSTNRNFMAGFSSGLTWPPSPIGDMLTYSNKLKQTVLVRVTASPLLKGFVHIQSGALKQIIDISTSSIKKLFEALGFHLSVEKCFILFNN